jgi:hypothetical protein
MIVPFGTPCWLVTPTPDREGFGPYHYLTEEAALAERAKLNTEDPEVVTYTVSRAESICLAVTCSECGDEPVDPDGRWGTVHFSSLDEFVDNARKSYDWIFRAGQAWCSEDCAPAAETRTPADALMIAGMGHHNQFDKAGRPYMDHVTAVAHRVERYGPDAVIIAYLHDVVEDTAITINMLRGAGFSETIISAVTSVTRRGDESYEDLINRAAKNPLGRLVKLADNADNSDPERLKLLDPGVSSYLTEKYQKARNVLTRRIP